MAAAERGERSPAASRAWTAEVCAAPAARPVTVALVALGAAEVATALSPAPTRTTSYPVAATSSVAAGQVRRTLEPVTSVATGAPGAVGAVVSGPPP